MKKDIVIKDILYKDILYKDIETTFDNLINELSKFDEETLNEVPFNGSWTAGQTAEHIIICGSGIPDTKTLEAHRLYNEKLNSIEEFFLNFDLKAETPSFLSPGPPPHDKEELIRKMNEIKAHLKNVAETTDLKALCEDMELPSFGLLTRYEWLRFILFHTQRHTHQIRNIGIHLAIT